MDSINQNQPEENHEDLMGADAVEKMKTLVEKANTCFFCTSIGGSDHFSTRPMSVQKVDDEGNIWFLSASDSKKNEEIGRDDSVQLLFQGSKYSDFLSLNGKATITTDKVVTDELWQPILKAWFTEGKDDHRITAIKITPTDGYYWDTKNGKIVSMIKTAIGAAIGKTLDDSIEGNLEL